MDLQLEGHVAVVTGGASGIGRATAELFAEEGCATVLWDVSPQTQTVAEELSRQYNCPVRGLTVDLRRYDAVQQAVQQTEETLGPIDHLVHAAAIGSGKFGFPFTELSPSDWPAVLEVNVMGMVHVAHAVTPVMQQRKKGTMVFVASVAGQIGSPTDPPYSASKAANINFAQCMAKDLAAEGIRVNTVCPGMVQTPLNKSVWAAWNARQSPENKRSYEDWAGEKVRQVVPLQRWQQPADIAEMIVFLSSDRAKNITGQTINVDGGYVMHW